MLLLCTHLLYIYMTMKNSIFDYIMIHITHTGGVTFGCGLVTGAVTTGALVELPNKAAQVFGFSSTKKTKKQKENIKKVFLGES